MQRKADIGLFAKPSILPAGEDWEKGLDVKGKLA
jgi:hypothetical protein